MAAQYMPVTHITFLIGCLAIAGIIPFAGFFSKDEILTACFGNSTVWYIWMSVVAGLTAFYMFRLYYLIFWWKEHKVHHPEHAPHDQPWTMTLPLVILGGCKLCGWIRSLRIPRYLERQAYV